jgi:hypothetical protein
MYVGLIRDSAGNCGARDEQSGENVRLTKRSVSQPLRFSRAASQQTCQILGMGSLAA